MPIKWQQTKQEQLEVMQYFTGQGPETKAVRDATFRYKLTFGVAMITREFWHTFALN